MINTPPPDNGFPSTPCDRPAWIDGSPGNFPWDRWQQRALDAGLPEALAQLGRAAMREAFNHAWDDDLQAECGWNDDGTELLSRLLNEPDSTRARLQLLLQTDGLRV